MVVDNITQFEHSLLPARVEAHTGPDGTGKLLGSKTLPLCVLGKTGTDAALTHTPTPPQPVAHYDAPPPTHLTLYRTHGDFDYTFEKFVFPFKGVARSVSFFPPLVDGNLVAYATLFDNVKVVVSDKLAKVVDVEAKAGEVKASLEGKLGGFMPDMKKGE